jgi:hypothetical protein
MLIVGGMGYPCGGISLPGKYPILLFHNGVEKVIFADKGVLVLWSDSIFVDRRLFVFYSDLAEVNERINQKEEAT